MDIEVSENKQHTQVKSSVSMGQRLKTAREALHLSEKDAAGRLHLGVHVINMIEKEDFKNAPPTTFLRGYLRSYARLLNIPETEIQMMLSRFEINNISAPTPALASASINTPINEDSQYPFVRWTTYLVIAMLVGLVVMWWKSHTRYTVADVPTKPTVTETMPLAEQIAPAPPHILIPEVNQVGQNIDQYIPNSISFPTQPDIDSYTAWNQPKDPESSPPASTRIKKKHSKTPASYQAQPENNDEYYDSPYNNDY